MKLIILASGQEVAVRDIMMFPRDDVWALLALRAKAQKELAGYSSGLGLIGSPSWVLGGSLALGAVEAVLSGIKERNGINLLNECAKRYDVLLRKGRWFSLDKVNGINLPQPSLWHANEPQEKFIELAALGWGKKGEIQSQYGLSNEEMKQDRVKVQDPLLYIPDGDEFIKFRDSTGELHVRWATISAVRIIC